MGLRGALGLGCGQGGEVIGMRLAACSVVKSVNYTYFLNLSYVEGKVFRKDGREEQAEMVQDRFRLEHGRPSNLPNPTTLDQLNKVIPF